MELYKSCTRCNVTQPIDKVSAMHLDAMAVAMHWSGQLRREHPSLSPELTHRGGSNWPPKTLPQLLLQYTSHCTLPVAQYAYCILTHCQLHIATQIRGGTLHFELLPHFASVQFSLYTLHSCQSIEIHIASCPLHNLDTSTHKSCPTHCNAL